MKLYLSLVGFVLVASLPQAHANWFTEMVYCHSTLPEAVQECDRIKASSGKDYQQLDSDREALDTKMSALRKRIDTINKSKLNCTLDSQDPCEAKKAQLLAEKAKNETELAALTAKYNQAIDKQGALYSEATKNIASAKADKKAIEDAQEELRKMDTAMATQFSLLGNKFGALIANNMLVNSEYDKLAASVDQTKLGLYMREKMKDMLNTPELMCPSQKLCKNYYGKENKVSESAMNILFSGYTGNGAVKIQDAPAGAAK